jgi:hypothetical protein
MKRTILAGMLVALSTSAFAGELPEALQERTAIGVVLHAAGQNCSPWYDVRNVKAFFLYLQNNNYFEYSLAYGPETKAYSAKIWKNVNAKLAADPKAFCNEVKVILDDNRSLLVRR